MKMRNKKSKAGFILIVSCVMCLNLCTAGTVFAEETDAGREEITESAVSETSESAVSEISESAVDETAEPAAEESGVSVNEEAVRKLLEALDNTVYAETFGALKGGEKITEGTTSDAAGGLQQTLADFGREIEIDNNAGPATFGILNEVLQEYGLEEADTMDAAAYADLLSLVLLSRNEDGSYDDILAAYYDREDDDGLYRYLTGCMYFQSERYYKALEAFEESGYRDYEEKMKACEQPWPESGELWRNSEVYGQDMYLTFQVNSHDESEGMCFEVYTEDGTLAAVLFQTGSGSVTTKLPGGWYRIKDATGETWYGRKDAFGRYGSYEFMTFDEDDSDEYLTQLDSGYEWTITINVTEGNPDATGVGAQDSDWESWAG